MVTISVLNQKGGAGKTTLATNLAAAGHLAGRRTTLLDLDRQGSAFDWYSARKDGSKLDGLAVSRADKALTLPKFRELARGAEIVVCDGPPRLGDVTRAAAVAADIVVIPLRPGGYDLWACDETLELLDSADQIRALAGQGAVPRVFVLNGAAPRTRAFAQVMDALMKEERRVCPVVVHNRTAFPESVPFGESVLTMFAASEAAREISELYAYVMELVAASSARPTGASANGASSNATVDG